MSQLQFSVTAVACDGKGEFDAAYDFGNGVGDEGAMTGSADAIGREVGRFLALLSENDCRQMEHGTGQFYVKLTIEPVRPGPEAIDPAEVLLGTQPHTGLRYATFRGWRLVAYAEGGSCHQQWSGDARLGWILCTPGEPMPQEIEAALERALGLNP